jgi:hypothetical protein
VSEDLLLSQKLVQITLEKIGHIRSEYNEGNIAIANAAAFHLLHDVETIMRMASMAMTVYTLKDIVDLRGKKVCVSQNNLLGIEQELRKIYAGQKLCRYSDGNYEAIWELIASKKKVFVTQVKGEDRYYIWAEGN